MAQLRKKMLIILVLAIVICSAAPLRYHKRLNPKELQTLKQRPAVQQKRVLARQEAVTPYPAADELKPDIPFEEGYKPDEVYGPPDETYGPPEFDQTPADQLPSEEDPEEFKFNADAEEFQPAKEEVVVTAEEKKDLRFTSKRKGNRKNISSRLVQKNKTRKPQRLMRAPAQIVATPNSALRITLPLSSSYAVQSQQDYFPNQPLAYTVHYHSW